VQQVHIRPSKIKVYLNALSEAGHFECRLVQLKYSDLADHDISSLILQCQKEFETKATLKYIFADDGAQIINLQ